VTEVVLVTGASRGVGAEIATQLADPQRHVIVNYREKAKRADAVVQEVVAAGGNASAVQADVSDKQAVAMLVAGIGERWGGLDALVLNASGGLEAGADPDYAMRLNCHAQVELARMALPLMRTGGRIIFVTSHLAHFHGKKPVPTAYLPIAVSKQAGEAALRAEMPAFEAAGVTFAVVSGDMIEGSTTVRLFERRDPAAVAARREASGGLPSAAEFATAIVREITDPQPSGETIYVGGPDYLK
jgi:3-oxoacyl-[acyl-carrier protein] reductase